MRFFASYSTLTMLLLASCGPQKTTQSTTSESTAPQSAPTPASEANPSHSQPSASASAPAGVREPPVASDLQIELSSPKASYAIGEEIHFRVELVNQGTTSLRLIESTAFLGERFVVRSAQGAAIGYVGGFATWSPKAGLFLGTTFLLQPNGRKTWNIDARVDHAYRLVFASHTPPDESKGFQRLREKHGLSASYPARYISSGRIFPIEKPGKLQVVYRYSTKESDKNWTFSGSTGAAKQPIEDLWLGRADSNVLELEIR